MEQNVVNCPKCSKEIGEVEFYKYHLRCKDCWNAYCKTHRYNNPEVNRRSMERYKLAHPVTERFCKCCKQNRAVEQFDPRKHFCKDCYRSPAEIKKAYQERRKEQLKIAKAKWYENNKEREREKHKKAYRAKVGDKPVKLAKVKVEKVKIPKLKVEKPIKIAKVKPVRIPKVKELKEIQYSKIKMTDTRVYPKVRDVRRGWDDTIAKLRAKFETT